LRVVGTTILQDATTLGSSTVVGTLNVNSSATVAGSLNVAGSATVGGTLRVGGTASLFQLNVTASSTISGGLTVAGLTTSSGLNLSSSATIAGGLAVLGAITGSSATVSGSFHAVGGYIGRRDLGMSRSSQTPGTASFNFGTYNNTNTVATPFADCIHFNTETDYTGGASNVLMLNKTTGTPGLRIYQSTATSLTDTGLYTVYRDAVLADSTGGATITGVLQVNGSVTAGNGYFPYDLRGGISRSSCAPQSVEFNMGTITNDGITPYSDCIHFNTWSDPSAGASNLIMFNKGPNTSTNLIGMRIYQSTAGQSQTATGAYTLYRDAVLADSGGGVTISGGLKVTGSVTATSYFATSDSRIKKNIIDISNSSLDILRKIQPRKYQHIDHEKQGSESIYGFIAQEVKQVLPAAVSTNPDFVPSIYENAFIDNKTITLINKSTNDILNGNIKLYDKNRNEIIVKKTNTITDKMFSIDAHVPDTQVSFVDEHGGPLEQRTYNGNTIFMKSDEEYRGMIRKSVFVYGHHVDDFHVLNKDTIWTILLSSTQELDKQVQANNTRLEAVNKQQEDRISELEATVKRQQAEIDEIKEMLKDCVYR